MTLSTRAWVHHAAMNLGVAVEALVWTVLPPVKHGAAGLRELRAGTVVGWFWYGCGRGPKPGGM